MAETIFGKQNHFTVYNESPQKRRPTLHPVPPPSPSLITSSSIHPPILLQTLILAERHRLESGLDRFLHDRGRIYLSVTRNSENPISDKKPGRGRLLQVHLLQGGGERKTRHVVQTNFGFEPNVTRDD